MAHNNNISIHRTADEQLIVDLHKLIFPEDEFHYSDNNIYWTAIHFDTPIGFCIATECGDSTLFLCRAGVLDSVSGTGLHRRMIRVREAYAARYNINNIVTYVKKDNWKSWVTLVKMNYQIYTPAHYWGANRRG